MKNPTVQTLHYFIKELGYNSISLREVEKNYLSHPDLENLNSITDTLKRLNVPCAALQVPYESISAIDDPFLVMLKTFEGNDFYLARNFGLNKIQIFSNNQKWSEISSDVFKKIYTDFVIISEQSEKLENIRYKIPSEVLPILLVICFSAFGYFISIDIKQYLFYCTSLIGLYISFNTYIFQFGKEARIFSKYCTTNRKNSCDNVLSSQHSKIFKDITFSDFAIVYFLFQIATLILSTTNSAIFHNIYVITYLVLPVSIYSIYLQKYVLKNWCIMCIALISILYIQSILSFFYLNPRGYVFSNYNYLFLLVVYITIFLSWHLAKTPLSKAYSYDILEIAYLKFKYNYKLFLSSLQKETTIDLAELPSSCIEINRDSSLLTFTLITNPSCSHCKKAITIIEKLLSNYIGQFKLNIIFNLPLRDKTDSSIFGAMELLQEYHNQPQGGVYIIKKYHSLPQNRKKLSETYQQDLFTLYYDILVEHKNWCDKNNIDITPTLFINNTRFPEMFDISDLPIFIDELIDINNNKTRDLNQKFITFSTTLN